MRRYLNFNQSGQTLIETLIAIFLLTMAMTTALGLAVYAISRSAVSKHEIVAINLAREGIDAVRAMRDSNWLTSEASSNTTFILQPCVDIGGRLCYPRSHEGYPLTAGNKIVLFEPNNRTWSLGSGFINANLFVNPSGVYQHNIAGTSIYSRLVNISFNPNPPFTNQNSNQEIIVKSVVVWRDKNCPAFIGTEDLFALNSNCKIVLEEHLTNWKDY